MRDDSDLIGKKVQELDLVNTTGERVTFSKLVGQKNLLVVLLRDKA